MSKAIDMAFKQGRKEREDEIIEIIDKRIKECKSCQLTDKYEEQIEEDQIMIDTLNYIKSEINSEKTARDFNLEYEGIK